MRASHAALEHIRHAHVPCRGSADRRSALLNYDFFGNGITVYRRVRGLAHVLRKKLDKTHFHPTVFKHCGKGYHTPRWAWKRVSRGWRTKEPSALEISEPSAGLMGYAPGLEGYAPGLEGYSSILCASHKALDS